MTEEQLRRHLVQRKGNRRFKIEADKSYIAKMLFEAYKFEVELRGGVYVEDEKTESFIAKCAKWLTESNKWGLMLYGTVGSGKTTLARAICSLIGALYDSTYQAERLRVSPVTAIELSKMAVSNPAMYERLKETDMLFIDDLGTEPEVIKNFGNDLTPIVEVLYHRADKQLFTIITTNKLDEEIRKLYGDRISDRIREMFDKLYFDGKSFRR